METLAIMSSMVRSNNPSAEDLAISISEVCRRLRPVALLVDCAPDNMLYTIQELANTLTLQEVPSYPNGTSQILSNVSIIPPDPPAGSKFRGTEILIPRPTAEYHIPYIYTATRNFGVQDPRGETIGIFENVDNQLVLRNQVYTGLERIRGMMSGEQAGFGGEAYIVAGADLGTGGVKVFKRTEGGANLEEVAVNTTIPIRTTFVWLN